jgi:hypothetical protein
MMKLEIDSTELAILSVVTNKGKRTQLELLAEFDCWMAFVAKNGTGPTHSRRILSLGGFTKALQMYRKLPVIELGGEA